MAKIINLGQEYWTRTQANTKTSSLRAPEPAAGGKGKECSP